MFVEVGGNISSWFNDSGFLTSFTEIQITDTADWDKIPNKITDTAVWSKITNKPFIPDTAPLESRLDLLESDSVNTENRLSDLETDSNQTQIKLNIIANQINDIQADSITTTFPLNRISGDTVTFTYVNDYKSLVDAETLSINNRLSSLESDSINTENRLLNLETDSVQTQIKLNDLNNQVNNINQDSIVLLNFSKIVGDTITSDSAYSLFLRNDVEGTIASRLHVSDTVNAVGFVGNGSDITGVMHTGDTFTSFITIPLRITESAGSTSSTTFVSKSQNLSNIFFNNWFDSSTVLVNDPDSITLHYSVQLNAGATNQIELEARVSANGIIYSSDTIASVNGTPTDTEIDIKLPISALSKLEGTDCRIRVSSGTGTVNYILHSIFMRIKYYKILGQ